MKKVRKALQKQSRKDEKRYQWEQKHLGEAGKWAEPESTACLPLLMTAHKAVQHHPFFLSWPAGELTP